MIADRHHAWRIVRSLNEHLKDQHNLLAKKSFAQQISFDDATGRDNREWCGVILGVDSTGRAENEVTSNFFFGLFELDYTQLSAEGMFTKVKEMNIDWSKVFFIGRDGAAVMIALVDLIIARLAPHAVGVYCGNHNCQLLLKDCFFGIPEFSLLIDSIHLVFTFFKYSTKSMSALQKSIKKLKGPKKPKRAQNLTRWTAVLSATTAILFLLPFLLQLWINALLFDKNLKSEQKEKIANLLIFWCDWRNIVLTVVMNFIGKFFVSFHLELQKRSTDFTVVKKQLKILTRNVNGCLNGIQSVTMAKSVESILIRCKNLKHLAKISEVVDFEVKLKDATKKHISESVHTYANQFVALFLDHVVLRFPNAGENEVVNALRIFDPETFPDLTVIKSKQEKEKLMGEFGRAKLKVLCDQWGEEKKREDGTIELAKIDRRLAEEQWGEFVEEYREWRGDSLKTFRQLVRKVLSLEANDRGFAIRFSEIIKLIKIAEVYPSSTADVERLFSCMKKTVTSQRTTIAPLHLESCMMISTEARRLFGKEPWTIVEMLPEIQERITKKRKEHSISVRKAQKAREARKNEEMKIDGKNEIEVTPTPSKLSESEIILEQQSSFLDDNHTHEVQAELAQDRPGLADNDDDDSEDFRDEFGSSDDSFESESEVDSPSEYEDDDAMKDDSD
jgi:hypothetical protein